MKKLKIILITIFSILILLPAGFLNTKSEVISDIDNRKLVTFPEKVEFSDKFISKLYTYLDDRYVGRELAVTNYLKLNNLVFNELEHPSYTYGEDGHVFLKMDDEIQYSDYHKKFAQSISKIRDYVESNGSKFYMMINPEKKSIYKEFLPKGVNYNRTWVEDFEKDLSKYGINYIDNTEELMAKSKDNYFYNKKFDAGHCNDLGAFYGVNNLLRLINKDFNNINELVLEDFDISEVEEPYLLLSKFPINEKIPHFDLKNANNYENLAKSYDIILDERYPTFNYIKNNSANATTLPRALVFKALI